jgi:hypothetical protein
MKIVVVVVVVAAILDLLFLSRMEKKEITYRYDKRNNRDKSKKYKQSQSFKYIFINQQQRPQYYENNINKN